MDITDYRTRGRGSATAFGSAMAYGFGGSRSGAPTWSAPPRWPPSKWPPTAAACRFFFSPFTENEKRFRFIKGYTFGVGIDWAVTRNFFVRAEYEFIDWYPFSDMTAYTNSIRGAVGNEILRHPRALDE